MKRYRNLNGNSGVAGYESGDDFIVIRFRDGHTYEYNSERPGRRHVSKMQALAEKGAGLATYINQHVRDHYARKLD